MNNLWMALLNQAIRALLSKDWSAVNTQVAALWNAKMTGEQKRQIVFDTLRSSGIEVATWLLNVAIEVAYGKLKNETKTT